MNAIRTAAPIAVTLFALLSACTTEPPLRPTSEGMTLSEYASSIRESEFGSSALGTIWTDAYAGSLEQSIATPTPVIEEFVLDPAHPRPVALRFTVMRGQRIEVDIESEDAQLFAELVQVSELPNQNQGDMDQPVFEPIGPVTSIRFEPRSTGTFVLRLLPAVLTGGHLRVELSLSASLGWPVPGTDKDDVWSYFGAGRDGGVRAHHGIDLFAEEGTPIVSVTDGPVRVGTRDRGGNVVTLHDEKRNINIYYAHLHEHRTEHGTLHGVGEELGTVGRTGNALYTPPHLHIGIYDGSWRRPVDPWYFLVQPEGTPESTALPPQSGSWIRLGSPQPALVAHPAGRVGTVVSPAQRDYQGNPVARELVPRLVLAAGREVATGLEPGTPVRLVGARGAYLRLELPTGLAGYVDAESVRIEAAAAAARTVRRAAGSRSPLRTAETAAEIPAGYEVWLLGLWDGLALVDTADFGQLWVPRESID